MFLPYPEINPLRLHTNYYDAKLQTPMAPHVNEAPIFVYSKEYTHSAVKLDDISPSPLGTTSPYNVQISSWHKRPWHSFWPELNLRRSRLHRLGFRRLCGQSEIYNRILFQIRQWSNLVEVETSGVHSHLNNRSKISSCVRCSRRGFMYFLDNPCIPQLRGSVEYECIMAVFTLSLWTVLV